MIFLTRKEEIAWLKKHFPKNTRLELVEMDDMQAPPVGTKGTVRGVDDMGNILMHWDNGSSLSVIYGVDMVKVIE